MFTLPELMVAGRVICSAGPNFAVVRPGDIALMAVISARYAQKFYSPFADSRLFYAAAAIVVLTGINIMGVKAGKWTQNLLTITKILGLLAISAAGLSAPEQVPHVVFIFLMPQSATFPPSTNCHLSSKGLSWSIEMEGIKPF
jgi:amino acid transporter